MSVISFDYNTLRFLRPHACCAEALSDLLEGPKSRVEEPRSLATSQHQPGGMNEAILNPLTLQLNSVDQQNSLIKLQNHEK